MDKISNSSKQIEKVTRQVNGIDARIRVLQPSVPIPGGIDMLKPVDPPKPAPENRAPAPVEKEAPWQAVGQVAVAVFPFIFALLVMAGLFGIVGQILGVGALLEWLGSQMWSAESTAGKIGFGAAGAGSLGLLVAGVWVLGKKVKEVYDR